jgi:hypothetical protein
VGAATFCDATVACVGRISSANSLVGSTMFDRVSYDYEGVAALADGSYAVVSREWDDAAPDVGAVTRCDGTIGCQGTISSANSLVGKSGDRIGGGGITVLANGGYVVRSPNWDDGGSERFGAATFCPATTGCSGDR